MGMVERASRAFLCAFLCASWPVRGREGAQASAAQNVHPAWAAGVVYKEDDLVSYVGVPYLCLKAHFSQVGKEPPAAPDLWRVFSGRDAKEPAVPEGLTAVPDGPSRIIVTWSQSPGAAGYDLQVDEAVVAGAASPYLHKGLPPASRHIYRVRAVNEAGISAWSEPVTCHSEKPAKPTS